MSDIDPEIYRLQDLLATIPPDWKGMNVVELDGYVAGLIVCPDTHANRGRRLRLRG